MMPFLFFIRYLQPIQCQAGFGLLFYDRTCAWRVWTLISTSDRMTALYSGTFPTRGLGERVSCCRPARNYLSRSAFTRSRTPATDASNPRGRPTPESRSEILFKRPDA